MVDWPGGADCLMRGCLPDGVAGLLADTPLKRVPGSFVDGGLRLHHADALFRAELTDGRPAYVYLLAEHKSWHDPWVPLQMAGYVIRIWKWHFRRKGVRRGVLPPVIPVLVHKGPHLWKDPLSVLDLVEADGPLGDLSRSMSCVLCDLPTTETAALPVGPETRAVLDALKHVWEEEVSDGVLDRILSDIPERSVIELQVVGYLFEAYGSVRQKIDRLRIFRGK